MRRAFGCGSLRAGSYVLSGEARRPRRIPAPSSPPSPDAFLGFPELFDERSPRVLDHAVDHDLVGSRGVAKRLLCSASLVGKVHHGPVMIRRYTAT